MPYIDCREEKKETSQNTRKTKWLLRAMEVWEIARQTAMKANIISRGEMKNIQWSFLEPQWLIILSEENKKERYNHQLNECNNKWRSKNTLKMIKNQQINLKFIEKTHQRIHLKLDMHSIKY